MRILSVILTICCLALTACSGSARLSMAPGEGHYTFEKTTTLPKAEAFGKVKTGIAVVYNDYQRVVKSEDATTGTFVLKPLVEIPTAGISMPYRYTLVIEVKDNAVTYDFTIGTNDAGGYPPASSMLAVQTNFEQVVDSIQSRM